MRWAAVFLVPIVVAHAQAVAAQPASAQPAPARIEARPSADERGLGDDAMAHAKFAEAVEHYRRAFEATNNPAVLFSMAGAYEGVGDFPKALDALQGFVDRATKQVQDEVHDLDKRLADAHNRVSTLVVRSAVPGAEIRIGDKRVGVTQAGEVIVRVNAGAAHVTVSCDGYFPFERDMTLEGGKSEALDLALAARPATSVIRVQTRVSGAFVAIDGRSAGVAPTEAIVAPGTHLVTVDREAYDAAELKVALGAGEKKTVDVPMKLHEPAGEKWWFWAALGTVLLAGGITAYAVVTR